MANIENLTPFTSETQPKNKGQRKRSKEIKKFTKDNMISRRDIVAMTRYIMPLPVEKVKDLLKDEKVPLFMRAFSKAMLADLAKGEVGRILKLFQLAYDESVKEDEKEKADAVMIYLPDNKRLLIKDEENIDK